jgi:hypothetical protein
MLQGVGGVVLLGKGRELFSVGCGCSEGGSIATPELIPIVILVPLLVREGGGMSL